MKPICKIDSRETKPGNKTYYYLLNDRKKAVDPAMNKVAAQIDKNGDGVISDRELSAYLQRDEVDILRTPQIVSRNPLIPPRYANYKADRPQVLKEYKDFLSREMPANKYYHSFEEITGEMKNLAEKYPDKAKLVSLGKTHEGREIWALKISKNVNRKSKSKKPGLVFTGAHHAREWVTPEIPLALAGRLLNEYKTDPAMKKRVDKSEIWIIPVANPDGFVYSHTASSMWRKNRRPIEQTACDLVPKPETLKEDLKEATCRVSNIKGYGVDLNRNYYDGNPEHYDLYRPEWDDPCSTADDMPSTSDNPMQLTYRGPYGGSENEVQALTKLTLKPEIKGIINYHSYGQMLLYPWGFTNDPIDNLKEYQIVGENMQKVMQDKYTMMTSCGLYPATGDPQDMQHINGKISYTLEMGKSFQPTDKVQIEKNVKDGTEAALAFIDHFLK